MDTRIPTVRPTAPTPPPIVKREYTTRDVATAWICFAVGYLFCRVVPLGDSPLGGMLFIWLLIAGVLVLLRLRQRRLSLLPAVALGVAAAMSASLVLTANPTVRFFAYALSIIACLYALYAATGNGLTGRLSDALPLDFLRALFVLPSTSLEHIFHAVAATRNKKGGGVLLKVLLGLAVTLIPTLVIASQLSYDADFAAVLDRLFTFEPLQIFSHIGSLLFGIPIGMYLYSLYIATADREGKDKLTVSAYRHALTKLRIAPTATAVTAAVPILALYALFFVTQWKYYLSAFGGSLPAGITYADYAREGFFQLCTVSVINLVIIAALTLLLRRQTAAPPRVLRILSLLFAIFTLILIATALSKMVLYIRIYGLTPKRVYATWGMVVLAAIFVLVIIKQFVRRLQLVALAMTVTVTLFTLLSLSGIDSLIASYNVDRYINGTLPTVDVEAFEELGEAAVPAVVRLAEHLDRQQGTEIAAVTPETLIDKVGLYQEVAEWLYQPTTDGNGLFAVTVPMLRADAAKKTAGITSFTESQWEDYCLKRYGEVEWDA